jgi:hypothetical protein
MINLTTVIEHSQERFRKEVENAEAAKGIDRARLHRRINETYFTRLTRACLLIAPNKELSDLCYSMCVACPELLFSKMYYLGWGQGRKQKSPDQEAPNLLKSYNNLFSEDTDVASFHDLLSFLKAQPSVSSLICHGLSPISDTLLLLADIGRNIRISHALGVMRFNVMLADVSWIKHNRSINQRMSKKEFLNGLRICLDKRKRLYRALEFEYKVFGINNFGREELNINRTALEKLTKEFRQLARVLWGEKSLSSHDPQMKKLIGKRFTGMTNQEKTQLSPDIATLISYENLAVSLEKELESQLTILRTISDLFSTFDAEIFFYYFAQFFAQQKYSWYIKIAPMSEIKFDEPFETQTKHFLSVMSGGGGQGAAGSNRKDKRAGKTNKKDSKSWFEIYLPQYKLGNYELLPYTSISGDVLKNDIAIDKFQSSTVLLEDSYEDKIDKVIGVITETPTPYLNRIVSDLLSFIHYLINRSAITDRVRSLEEYLFKLEPHIAEQIFSRDDTPVNYPSIFADWLKAIDDEAAIPPFHVIPYLWEERDWDKERIKTLSALIIELLRVVNDLCD